MSVENLHRAALNLHLDPDRASGFQARDRLVAGQGTHLDQMFGIGGEDGVAIEFFLHLQGGMEANGHAQAPRYLVGLVHMAGAGPTDV